MCFHSIVAPVTCTIYFIAASANLLSLLHLNTEATLLDGENMQFQLTRCNDVHDTGNYHNIQ